MAKARQKTRRAPESEIATVTGYSHVLSDMVDLLQSARHAAARTVNAVMTAVYWEMGRRIVQVEQGGEVRADYGKELLVRLSADLTKRFGRGFSADNLELMRKFWVAYPSSRISETVSRKFTPAKSETLSRKLPPNYQERIFQTPSEKSVPAISQTASGLSGLTTIAHRFPLPWSHYARLLTVAEPEAREFYEAEALRGGWSVRQLDRQIATLFYERTLLSRNKAAMLRKGQNPLPQDAVTPEQEIKDPFVLEFLDLKDEYSESDLEEGLILELEHFLLELGGDFAFVARQRRLRVGGKWYRIDLLFFHRILRCLVVIDLKMDEFTHADAGQMHLYLNYAREHWTHPNENPPVGLILCAQKDSAVAKYALDGLPNKVLAAQYKLSLPNPEALADELNRTRKLLEAEQTRKPTAQKRRQRPNS
jgi:predicted nuclease of restriction endonuclease-like (RecB) superfamily